MTARLQHDPPTDPFRSDNHAPAALPGPFRGRFVDGLPNLLQILTRTSGQGFGLVDGTQQGRGVEVANQSFGGDFAKHGRESLA